MFDSQQYASPIARTRSWPQPGSIVLRSEDVGSWKSDPSLPDTVPHIDIAIALYQLKLQLESAWVYLNTQHKLYFKVFNGGEVKPPPMKSISDPRFALPRLPPVLRSSVVPLVPTVNNCHNCDRGNIVTWCTQHKTPRCSIIMFGNLNCSTISAWSKDGFYLRRDPRAA